MSRQQWGWAILCLLILAGVWCGLMLFVSAFNHQWGYALLYTVLGAVNSGNANHLHRTLKRG